MTKKKQEEIMPYVIGGGIIIAYFGVIRPVMKKIGIVKSEDTKKVEQFEQLPAEENPFNSNYFDIWSKYYFKYKPESEWTFYKHLNTKYSTGITKKLFMLQAMDNAFGYFYDDEDYIYSFFDVMWDKLSVAYFAKFVKERTGKELLYYLKTGKNLLPANGLNDSELLVVINKVKSLPKYLPANYQPTTTVK